MKFVWPVLLVVFRALYFSYSLWYLLFPLVALWFVATLARDPMFQLREALQKLQLQLHYQAQIDLPSGRVKGAEALARWPHPVSGMVPPSVFIPVAEEPVCSPPGWWASACASARAGGSWAWHHRAGPQPAAVGGGQRH